MADADQSGAHRTVAQPSAHVLVLMRIPRPAKTGKSMTEPPRGAPRLRRVADGDRVPGVATGNAAANNIAGGRGATEYQREWAALPSIGRRNFVLNANDSHLYQCLPMLEGSSITTATGVYGIWPSCPRKGNLRRTISVVRGSFSIRVVEVIFIRLTVVIYHIKDGPTWADHWKDSWAISHPHLGNDQFIGKIRRDKRHTRCLTCLVARILARSYIERG